MDTKVKKTLAVFLVGVLAISTLGGIGAAETSTVTVSVQDTDGDAVDSGTVIINDENGTQVASATISNGSIEASNISEEQHYVVYEDPDYQNRNISVDFSDTTDVTMNVKGEQYATLTQINVESMDSTADNASFVLGSNASAGEEFYDGSNETDISEYNVTDGVDVTIENGTQTETATYYLSNDTWASDTPFSTFNASLSFSHTDYNDADVYVLDTYSPALEAETVGTGVFGLGVGPDWFSENETQHNITTEQNLSSSNTTELQIGLEQSDVVSDTDKIAEEAPNGAFVGMSVFADDKPLPTFVNSYDGEAFDSYAVYDTETDTLEVTLNNEDFSGDSVEINMVSGETLGFMQNAEILGFGGAAEQMVGYDMPYVGPDNVFGSDNSTEA